MVEGQAPDLLGRHVADGSHDLARFRETGDRRRLRRVGGILRPGIHPRQPEVQDLHVVVARDEDVVGLQVPMNDALLVRGRETERDLGAVPRRLAGRERMPGDRRAERLSIEKLRHRVRDASIPAEVVERQDVRM